MKMKRTVVVGIAALALTSIGGVAAFAGSSTPSQDTPATSESTAGVDTDKLQEGDQTTPDTGSEPANEQGEPAGESDGPGGHEDPPGQDVDHQFEGQE